MRTVNRQLRPTLKERFLCHCRTLGDKDGWFTLGIKNAAFILGETLTAVQLVRDQCIEAGVLEASKARKRRYRVR